jgi:hypothetical protein
MTLINYRRISLVPGSRLMSADSGRITRKQEVEPAHPASHLPNTAHLDLPRCPSTPSR